MFCRLQSDTLLTHYAELATVSNCREGVITPTGSLLAFAAVGSPHGLRQQYIPLLTVVDA